MEQITNIIRWRNSDISRQHFLVISGDDGIAHTLMQAGADGLISVAGNAFPQDFYEIVHNTYGRSVELQDAYQQLIYLLFKEGNPAGIKTVLAEKQLIHNILRLPLVPNSAAVQAQLRTIINNFGSY